MTNDSDDDNPLEVEAVQVEIQAEAQLQEGGLRENSPVAKNKRTGTNQWMKSVDDIVLECCPTLKPEEQEKVVKRLTRVMGCSTFQNADINGKKHFFVPFFEDWLENGMITCAVYDAMDSMIDKLLNTLAAPDDDAKGKKLPRIETCEGDRSLHLSKRRYHNL
jgi:hypothetical protein